jgi:hippurate hydrolase
MAPAAFPGSLAGPALRDIIALRHELHQHPEIRFQERWTSDRIARFLDELGIPHTRGHAKGTGIVALVRGGPGRTVALRADMDALEVQEETGLPYSSLTPGLMHACGHDGHTAMLLSAARHLAATRNFDGIVHLVFQPAEEGLAGARKMLEDGFLELFPCDAMFGMHNAPGVPEGKFVAIPGFAMASGDTCIIKVRGVGGHGAIPQSAVDPVLAGAAIVMALQSIVSRNVPPLHAGIVTVGAFLAGDAPNVIPGEAELRLTVRALRPEVRDLLERRIGEIATTQAAVFGASAEVDYIRRYPVLNNDPAQTAFCQQVVRDWLGADGLIEDAEPVTASEDFAFFLEKVPGCYVNIGNGVGSEGGCMVHNPGYDFNDRVLSTGASYWVRLAEACLPRG